MQLYLIRHTKPEIESGICYGQSDILLKDSFEDEWQAVKENLPSNVDALYSSPLIRCMRLAEKISDHLSIPVIQDNRLMEMHFGDWELQKWNDIDRASLDVWMNNYTKERCPNGESYEDLLKRIKLFLFDIKFGNEENVIAVTHGGVIKLTESILHPDSAVNHMEMKVDYGGVYKFEL